MAHSSSRLDILESRAQGADDDFRANPRLRCEGVMTTGEGRPKLAMYWASSCGGCEVALANLHERLFEVTEAFDFFFCPCLLDTKRSDVEALADGELALTLFNGAIRTDENAEWARLLRRKSKLLVAFGACAYGGGIPALSNLHTREQHLDAIYGDSPSNDNPGNVRPQEHTVLPDITLHLPVFHERVSRLQDVVDVDASVPGCPPEPDRIYEVVRHVASGLPVPHGAVLGGTDKSVCEECSRTRADKQVPRLRRVTEFEPNRTECLLEQGLVCMGIATRGGCGALCPDANMPCIGCYGPPQGVYDQGAKMVSALGAILDITTTRELRDESEIAAHIDEAIAGLPDVAGMVGKFHSVRGRARMRP
jgi:F420-non-reducing hydrogenase small subunit